METIFSFIICFFISACPVPAGSHTDTGTSHSSGEPQKKADDKPGASCKEEQVETWSRKTVNGKIVQDNAETKSSPRKCQRLWTGGDDSKSEWAGVPTTS